MIYSYLICTIYVRNYCIIHCILCAASTSALASMISISTHIEITLIDMILYVSWKFTKCMHGSIVHVLGKIAQYTIYSMQLIYLCGKHVLATESFACMHVAKLYTIHTVRCSRKELRVETNEATIPLLHTKSLYNYTQKKLKSTAKTDIIRHTIIDKI